MATATAPTERIAFASSSSGPRIGQLDALRGLALGGILLVNIGQIMHMPGIVDLRKLPIPHVLDMTAHQRFFPLFSLLFGVGFGIFLQRAGARAQRPRLLLLRRLVALAVLGAVHHLLQPGEALLWYALFGIVVLLPLSWVPRWINLAIGLTMTVVLTVLFGGGLLLVPGLLVTGFALAQLGLPNALDRLGPHLLTAFVLAAAGSVAALLWQEQDPLSAGFTPSSAVAGLTMAVAYATGLLLVLRTPVGRRLAPTLEALGRMALTNYITATLLIVSFGAALGLEGSTAWPTMLGFAAAILVVQALWSRWWLARFRYGPLEWAWRCVTWWRRFDLR
ncbi:putative membrane protein YeiB [Saccharopolyspora erythraea NRRL 2338]|uniref:Conserved membrane spanning protein n=2 Tax=Saccharopolyspora erythraea TaxID=1836 RepID=A4F774_SACEN|nr:DUF418 domain-containing protein [Saccharopolyspora erythraea]PFG93701.1 putative membrane protein YeiB [Saccharopolyspora erythraea NRRL 2338]QRK90545.1 DUF418 domain-containing protein [Saccharopolyspora erythraea]CAL99898.1 conserved membrane spanning protein [Saccharopolyspora erythraea NRRL 2338]